MVALTGTLVMFRSPEPFKEGVSHSDLTSRFPVAVIIVRVLLTAVNPLSLEKVL